MLTMIFLVIAWIMTLLILISIVTFIIGLMGKKDDKKVIKLEK